MEPTSEEKSAIAALKRLSKKWPKTLWIFVGDSDGFAVMRKGKNGEHVHTKDCCVDQNYIVAEINIESDGGEW